MWTTCQRFEKNKYNKASSTRIRIFLNPQLFSLWIRLQSTGTYPVNLKLFESALQRENF